VSPKPGFCQNKYEAVSVEKGRTKSCTYSFRNFQENHRPLGENTPNLVTLLAADIWKGLRGQSYKTALGSWF
jgi:hypothetical protein